MSGAQTLTLTLTLSLTLTLTQNAWGVGHQRCSLTHSLTRSLTHSLSLSGKSLSFRQASLFQASLPVLPVRRRLAVPWQWPLEGRGETGAVAGGGGVVAVPRTERLVRRQRTTTHPVACARLRELTEAAAPAGGATALVEVRLEDAAAGAWVSSRSAPTAPRPRQRNSEPKECTRRHFGAEKYRKFYLGRVNLYYSPLVLHIVTGTVG